jgi:hypothetical protein
MSQNLSEHHNDESLYLYSPESVIKQAATADDHLGYKILTFFVEADGSLAKSATDKTEVFYLSPSGGTLRDTDLNIVLYSAKYDLYKGLGKTS